MKKVLLALLVIGFLSACGSNNKSKTIYVVRHAEKMLTQDSDPDLAQVGRVRSIKLSQILEDKDIKHIFSTDYKRTRNTAQPTSDLFQLPIQSYDPRDQEGFAKSLMELDGNVLVVGHSNTAPGLVNILIGEDTYPDLTDVEYDNIYIVSLGLDGTTSEVKTFGDY